LGEPREDIPLRAQHFINLFVKEMGCAKTRLTHAGMVQLQGYDCPGNIRELRNVTERAVILVRGGTFDIDLQAAKLRWYPHAGRHGRRATPSRMKKMGLRRPN
jgi:DNA-binding NtrC family response regulator